MLFHRDHIVVLHNYLQQYAGILDEFISISKNKGTDSERNNKLRIRVDSFKHHEVISLASKNAEKVLYHISQEKEYSEFIQHILTLKLSDANASELEKLKNKIRESSQRFKDLSSQFSEMMKKNDLNFKVFVEMYGKGGILNESQAIHMRDEVSDTIAVLLDLSENAAKTADSIKKIDNLIVENLKVINKIRFEIKKTHWIYAHIESWF